MHGLDLHLVCSLRAYVDVISCSSSSSIAPGTSRCMNTFRPRLCHGSTEGSWSLLRSWQVSAMEYRLTATGECNGIQAALLLWQVVNGVVQEMRRSAVITGWLVTGHRDSDRWLGVILITAKLAVRLGVWLIAGRQCGWVFGRGEFRPRQTRQLPRAVDLKGRLLSCQSY